MHLNTALITFVSVTLFVEKVIGGCWQVEQRTIYVI